MTTPAREQFVLEELSDGAILLDVAAGVLFRLNLSAAFVWGRALAGADRDTIVADFADTFHVSKTVADADVAAALAPPDDGVGWALETETHYESLGGGTYRFSVQGKPTLEIASSDLAAPDLASPDRSLRLRTATEFTANELYFHLKAVSPKLVALLGHPVLHASAVQRHDGAVMAFLGASGAGKTTTARAFAAAGLRMICEDKLILKQERGDVLAVVDGEARIDDWIGDMRVRLGGAGPNEWCDVGSLDDAAAGATATVGAVVVLDQARRRGDDIRFDRLGPARAASEVFEHAFYGSFAAAEWSRYVAVAAAIARAAPTYAATVPNGSASLVAAARRYIENTQS